jgi:hypothetical protein
VIYEISDDTMTVVAILPKGDNTYDLDQLRDRLGPQPVCTVSLSACDVRSSRTEL